MACQTWIEGTFVREFTESPAGSLPPNGHRVVWDQAMAAGSLFRVPPLRTKDTRRLFLPTSGLAEVRDRSPLRATFKRWPFQSALLLLHGARLVPSSPHAGCSATLRPDCDRAAFRG
jgi:hypothetical protein